MLKEQNPFKFEFFKHFGLITRLGLSVVVSIVICVLGFNYLDKKLQTNGNLLIVGVVLGVILGMIAAYRQLKKYYER